MILLLFFIALETMHFFIFETNLNRHSKQLDLVITYFLMFSFRMHFRAAPVANKPSETACCHEILTSYGCLTDSSFNYAASSARCHIKYSQQKSRKEIVSPPLHNNVAWQPHRKLSAKHKLFVCVCRKKSAKRTLRMKLDA